MGQEAFDIEDCVQEKNKRKRDINMLRKTKRTLSLVLALIMICSTMGVMALAAASNDAYECPKCPEPTRDYYEVEGAPSFNRIIECPKHDGHDAEEYYVQVYRYCSIHDVLLPDATYSYRIYICLD